MEPTTKAGIPTIRNYGLVQRTPDHSFDSPEKKENKKNLIERMKARRQLVYDYLEKKYSSSTEESLGHHFNQKVPVSLVYYQIQDISRFFGECQCPLKLSSLELYVTDGKINREMFVRKLEEKGYLGQVLRYIGSH